MFDWRTEHRGASSRHRKGGARFAAPTFISDHNNPAWTPPDMTVAVLATTTTKTKRREPLGTIAMAAPKTQSRSAAASSGTGKAKERRTTRLSASKQELENTNKLGKRTAGE